MIEYGGRNGNVNRVFALVPRITETYDESIRGGVSECVEIREAAFRQWFPSPRSVRRVRGPGLQRVGPVPSLGGLSSPVSAAQRPGIDPDLLP